MSYVIAGAACLVGAAVGFVAAAILAAGHVKALGRLDDDMPEWADDAWFDAMFAELTAPLEDAPFDQEAE